MDIMDVEESYLNLSDWEVKENANTSFSFGSFIDYLLDAYVKRLEEVAKILPEDAVRAHFLGEIHIHKLPYSLWIPYCAGWSLERILRKGLLTPTVVSKPAKHFDSATSHLINFFYLAAQEWTGAQAVTAFDLYMAPFIRRDNLSEEQIRQTLQKFLFELNYPTRIGYQSPFTNITIILDTVKDYLDANAIVDGKVIGKLRDYLDESILLTKQLFSLYLEGDARGRSFTFPIVTMMFTKNFDWNNEKWNGLSDVIFETLARRGSLYILNGYANDVSGLYAMCCRLTIDTNKINNFNFKLEAEDLQESLRKKDGLRGLWALPEATGSIGVVTLNLPRIAMISNGEDDYFFEQLTNLVELANSVLITWRRRYEKFLKLGLMPMTKIYLGTLMNHYNTFGVIGLPEMASIHLDLPWTSEYAEELIHFEQKVVGYLRELSKEYEEKYGYLYNIEEVPGESAGYRLAMSDYKFFKKEFAKEYVPSAVVDGQEVFFYSNSIVPYYARIGLAKRVELEAQVQQEFTGGVMMHLFLSESPDVKALKRLIYNIVTKTKIVYFSITPTISVCLRCGKSFTGIYFSCPNCGGETEIWSRIVGYYRPIKVWNVGKRAEFKLRYRYTVR